MTNEWLLNSILIMLDMKLITYNKPLINVRSEGRPINEIGKFMNGKRKHV